ncbi:hypothetical protein ACIQNU_27310 [Streptomyces sp. NPDC091292]|uniref:hypothetical protein n=1 Tax=Streptomyces sp. NPDC091292 TaxID=3365991 RepID=UPI003812A82C
MNPEFPEFPGLTGLPECAQTVDANEIAALTDWAASLDPGTAAEFGVRTELFGTALAVLAPGTETVFFNRVVGLSVLQEPSRTLVHDIADFYRDAGARCMVHTPASNPDDELPAWLGEEGMEPQGEWITLRRGTENPPPPDTDLRVRTVGPSDATSFAETLCTGYGMPDEWAPLYEGLVGRPGWRHYMAWDGDLPVATASLFLHGTSVPHGTSAWCGNSGTLRRYRRRGAHTALSRLRLKDGLAEGASLFTGETWQQRQRARPNQSLKNHTRDGWQEVYHRVNYVTATTD